MSDWVAPEDLDGEVRMDMMASPAMLGGLMMAVAWGAWVLGRWQGAAAAAAMALPVASDRQASESAQPNATQQAASPRVTAAAFTSPCQQDAADERHLALTPDISLGDLHEEISAYRRREQVLASLDPGAFQFDRAAQDCRYVGLTGQPVCPAPANVRQGCGTGCASFTGALSGSAFARGAGAGSGVGYEILEEHCAGEDAGNRVDRGHDVEPAQL
jgi:hypothetical protein